jgi:hypothetical protein
MDQDLHAVADLISPGFSFEGYIQPWLPSLRVVDGTGQQPAGGVVRAPQA